MPVIVDCIIFQLYTHVDTSFGMLHHNASGVATPEPTWACALVNFTSSLVNHWL